MKRPKSVGGLPVPVARSGSVGVWECGSVGVCVCLGAFDELTPRLYLFFLTLHIPRRQRSVPYCPTQPFPRVCPHLSVTATAKPPALPPLRLGALTPLSAETLRPAHATSGVAENRPNLKTALKRPLTL